ncbi:MAG: sigma-54 dependent transcriptional regulator [Planctomycetota bacterium]
MDKSPGTTIGTVLVIDDDEAARLSISQMLKLRGYRPVAFASAGEALAWPGLNASDCVICDVKMPVMSGEDFLKETQRSRPAPQVIMITGHGDVSMAVRCLKAGAYDFVEKPFEDEVLLASVARAAEKTALKRESTELQRKISLLSPGDDGAFGMVGRSPAMQELYAQIRTVAPTTAPVLVMGETGTGKELVSKAIHDQSSREGKSFVAVNAGALAESMLESELFGHAKGAFTGADRERDGKLVAATGGTLLLDEIESISVSAQVKLLRVLEEGMLYPLGKDVPRKVDIRFVATTKVDLGELVRKGGMREDFYHRIMVFPLSVPTLRERPEDIPLLMSYFLTVVAAKNKMPVPELPEETLAEMIRYPWPGNVRELRNVVERMVITAREGKAGPFKPDQEIDSARLLSLPATAGRLRAEMERTEKQVIETALSESDGRVSLACATLGISRRALYERMKKYGLTKEDFREG